MLCTIAIATRMWLFKSTHRMDSLLSFALGLFLALSIFSLIARPKKSSESTQ